MFARSTRGVNLVDEPGEELDPGRCHACGSRVRTERSNRMTRMLGPVSVSDSDHLMPIGGALQQATLAVLVTRRGTAVSAEVIADALYGEDTGGRSTLRVVHTYVSNLRRNLGDVIASTPGGYRFDHERLTVDADRFTALVRAGRNLRGEDPERSVRLLESAVALWRGDPYAGLEDVELLRPEIVRLGEQLIDATALLNEIRLELGRCHEAIPELSAIVAAHPYRENLVALLMWALHQSGATGQARRVYVDTARLLRDELGARPSRLLDEALDRLDVDSVVPGPIALRP
jgi:DNA-binding SARP family transcriptional activator